jgi:hypothetical protein
VIVKTSMDDRSLIAFLTYVSNSKKDLFSIVNSFKLVAVRNKDGRFTVSIPAWPILMVLIAFFVVRSNYAK